MALYDPNSLENFMNPLAGAVHTAWNRSISDNAKYNLPKFGIVRGERVFNPKDPAKQPADLTLAVNAGINYSATNFNSVPQNDSGRYHKLLIEITTSDSPTRRYWELLSGDISIAVFEASLIQLDYTQHLYTHGGRKPMINEVVLIDFKNKKDWNTAIFVAFPGPTPRFDPFLSDYSQLAANSAKGLF